MAPHENIYLATGATPLIDAHTAVVLLHGRGASAETILTLAHELEAPEGVAFLAPQADGHTWYPYSFLAPRERNEPWLTAALDAVGNLVDKIVEADISRHKIVLMGFSQGACLAQEFAARHATRYGGVVGFSGGLIGPEVQPDLYSGSFDGTPVFLGCSDTDAHIPENRVHASATLLESLGAEVTTRIYPGMGHTINRDEIKFASDLLHRVAHL